MRNAKFTHVVLTLVFSTIICLAGCGGSGGDQGPQGPPGIQGPAGSSASAMVIVPDATIDIQAAIDSLPAAGGTVFVRAGVRVLNAGVRINRSNVALQGEPGTILKLANGVNQPVILVGSAAETPAIVTWNISISNLEIDGNMLNQTSEIDPNRRWLRNNGIDVRMVDGLTVANVNIHNCRSGGLVASWKSANIMVTGSRFHHNFFDGIALYDSRDIIISDFISSSNNSAGISLDNALADTFFVNGIVEGNGDVGIFARASTDLIFSNLQIFRNQNHGIFLSHQVDGTGAAISGSGVTRLFIEGVSFVENNGYGLWLASPATVSAGNVLSNSLFAGNTDGTVKLDQGASLGGQGNVYQ